MLCLGNICRSPMAESVATALVAQAGLGGAVVVESYGTSAAHVGQPADPRARAALVRGGWPTRPHHARQLSADALATLDLVCAADAANLAAARRLGAAAGTLVLLRTYDPQAVPGRDDEVPDPYAGGDAGFDACLALIERSCRGLVAELARHAR